MINGGAIARGKSRIRRPINDVQSRPCKKARFGEEPEGDGAIPDVQKSPLQNQESGGTLSGVVGDSDAETVAACLVSCIKRVVPIEDVIGQRRSEENGELEVRVRWKETVNNEDKSGKAWVRWEDLNKAGEMQAEKFSRDQAIRLGKGAEAGKVEVTLDDDGNPYYEIERVLRCTTRKERWFLVRWKNYSSEHDSWVKEEHMSSEAMAIVPHRRKNKKRTRGRSSKAKQGSATKVRSTSMSVEHATMAVDVVVNEPKNTVNEQKPGVNCTTQAPAEVAPSVKYESRLKEPCKLPENPKRPFPSLQSCIDVNWSPTPIAQLSSQVLIHDNPQEDMLPTIGVAVPMRCAIPVSLSPCSQHQGALLG